MNTEEFFQSKQFKAIILGIAGIIVLVFIFGLGVFVGERRADFSFEWAEQYHNNFGGPIMGFLGNMMERDFMDANGCFGRIIKIEGQALTIVGANNVEKAVLINEDTIIKYQTQDIKLSDLKADANVVVIGSPNDQGQIEAKLIRVIKN